MKITDIITEAASPAMKKAGKKPRSVDEDLTRRGFLRGLGAAAVAGVAGNALAGSNDPNFVRKVHDQHNAMMEKNPRYAKEHDALGIYIARGIAGASAENNKRWVEKTAELLQKYGVKVNEGVAEGSLEELSTGLLQRAAQVAKDKRNKAMDPKIHNALGGGYMNPLAKHYDTVSQKLSNKAAKAGQQDAIEKIASPAVMRKMGMSGKGATEGVAEGYQLDEGAVETITALVKKIPGIGKYYQMAQQYKPQLIEILKTSKSGKEVKQKMEQLAAGQSATVAESGMMKQLGGLAVGGGSILSTMWMNAMGMIDGVLAHAAAGEVGGAVASGSILGLIPVTLMLFAAMLMFKGSNQSSDEKAQAFQAQRGQQGVAEDTELAEEFDLIESIVEMIAEHNGVDAEAVWADLESLTEDELYVFAVTSDPLMEDWQKANKRDKTDGMSQKAVNAYRRENPGSKLKTAVTTKPGKLKKGGKASKRRKSYCSRSRGQMKMHSISCAKTPDKAICKARRRWNC